MMTCNSNVARDSSALRCLWQRLTMAVALTMLLFGFHSTASAEPLTVNWYHKQRYLQPVVNAFTEQTGIEVIVTNAYDEFNTDVIFVSDYKSLSFASWTAASSQRCRRSFRRSGATRTAIGSAPYFAPARRS